MHFLEWNNTLAAHFFNSRHSGKDIFLFITKPEIINLAKKNFNGESDQEIWNDYLRKIRNGLPGSNSFPFIFDKAVHAYQQWNRAGLKSIEGFELKYPPYIGHLVFAVLPLIEIQGDYYATNYYDRLEDFLEENNIQQNLRNKLKEIDILWADLSIWSNKTKGGELGCFRELRFTHETRKFVYKPFSQCVLTPKAIKKLPDFFFASGLTPNTFYQDEVFRHHLSRKGIEILGLKPSTIEIIRKPEDEIGNSILETVRSEFNEWTGEEHEIILKEGVEKIIRKNTVVPVKLQFKINEDSEVDFSFRVNYATEPPPGLKLGEFDDIYENDKWSRTIRKQFTGSIFELRDIANKWIAKFEFRNIRLFVRGHYFLLSNDFWIEIESLLRAEEMFLLCRNEINASIIAWGEESCVMFKDCSSYPNIPSGYSLFRFKNPRHSHPEYQQLRVYKDKTISVRSGTGLKIGYRIYLNELPPEVEVSNSDGSERVYLQYEGETQRKYLTQHPTLGGIWLLPDNLIPNSSFVIQIENEFIEGIRQTYKVDEPQLKELSVEALPKRNKFNSPTDEADQLIQGNKILLSGFNPNSIDRMSFEPNIKADIYQEPFKFSEGLLVKWLVAVKECDILKYNEAFETIFHNTFEEGQHDVLTKRKFSIYILDNLGFVDFDEATKKIFSLPPKLIFIPSSEGRKVMLTGLRSEKLVNEMIDYCLNSNGKISLAVKNQNEQNRKMLIPDSIILSSNNRKEFADIANRFQLEFDEWFLLKQKAFLPTLFQYEQHTMSRGTAEAYERNQLETKAFRRENLKFEFAENFDKNYSLVEFRPTFITEYGLWINQSYYSIREKNWGKYLFINHVSKKEKGYGNGVLFSRPQEIFYNSNSIAVPASLPLPKLIARLMMQLSGEAPEFKQLNLKEINVWYNVYRNVPSLFTQNFFRFVLNMNIESTTLAI